MKAKSKKKVKVSKKRDINAAMVLSNLTGKTIASKEYRDMNAAKRAEVEDHVDLTLKKEVNRHVKGKVLQVCTACTAIIGVSFFSCVLTLAF